MRRWFFTALVAVTLAYSAGWLVEGYEPADAAKSVRSTARVVAVGDIACPATQPVTALSCQQKATAATAQAYGPDAALLLGDIQYPEGSLKDFKAFDESWGVLRDKFKPTPGNHEWLTPKAAGYYKYFGTEADDGRGYYSFDLGAWHLIALDTDCYWLSVGCGPKSAQYKWLENDLKTHPGQCTLAFYHHPIVTSGQFRTSVEQKSPGQYFFKLLERYWTDLVLNGHDHIYERFGHLDGNGKPYAGGTREIVAGMGGRSHSASTGRVAGSEYLDTTHFGVLELELGPGDYTWHFVDTAGQTLDAGTDICNNALR